MKVEKIISLLSLSFVLLGSLQASVDTAYLNSQGITLNSRNIDQRYIDAFMREFRKFPAALHQEIVSRGGGILLIVGDGVTDDPNWGEDTVTNNGRRWDSVPGSGGFPYEGTPTRIVVNSLNSGHGSSNLVLHEHAHSLDSTYSVRGVSNSQVWKDLMEEARGVSEFLRSCGHYCNGDEAERFAELFSLYYNSGKSRSKMQQEIPEVAEFFANLTSVRNVTNTRSSSRAERQESRQEPRQEPRQETRQQPRQETRQQPNQRSRQEPREEGRRITPEQQEQINEATQGLPWYFRWAAGQLHRFEEGEFSFHADVSSDDEGIYVNQTSSDERFDTGYSEYDRQGTLRSGNGTQLDANESRDSNGSSLEKPPGANRGPKPPRNNSGSQNDDYGTQSSNNSGSRNSYSSGSRDSYGTGNSDYGTGSRDNYGSGSRDNYGSGKPPASNNRSAPRAPLNNEGRRSEKPPVSSNRHDHEALNDNNNSRSIKPPQGSGKPPTPPQSSQAPRPGKQPSGPSGKLPSTSSKPK